MNGGWRLVTALAAGLALAGGTLTPALAAAPAPMRHLVRAAAAAADPAVLSMSSSVSPSPLVIGETAVYTVTVSNTGDAAATSVTTTLPFTPEGTVSIGPALPTGCASSGQTVTCTAATIPAGASVTYQIPVTVLPGVSDGTNIDLRGTATAAGGLTANTDLITQAFTQVDVQIRKHGPATANPSGSITYVIAVTNHGPSDAASVAWHDPMDGNLVSITGYPCGNTGLTVTCDVATMTPGETKLFRITVAVNGNVPAGTVITNCATVDTGTRPETNPDNNTSCAETNVDPVVPVADVEVTKTGPATVHAGDTMTYTLGVTNLGPDKASRVIVKDPLDEPRVTVEKLPAGCADHSGTVICDAGTLDVGETKTFSITVKVADGLAAGTQITDCAQATSSVTLLNRTPDERSCIQTVVVASATADISITKTGPAEIGPSGTFSYTLTATNNGPEPADDVVVTDPTDPSLVTVTDVTAGCGVTDGTVTCPVGTMAVGESRTFTITVQVNPGVRGAVIPNCGQDITSTEDPDLTNNQACVNTAVDLVNPNTSNIRVVKHGRAVVHPGGTITYIIDVTNRGPGAAAGVIITDPISPSLTVISFPPGCSLRGSTGVCLIGRLDVHQVKTLTFTVRVSPDATPGTYITNCAAAASNSVALTRGAAPGCVQTIVLPTRTALLSITKSAPVQVTPDGTLTYTLSIANHGPNAAADVIIKDPVEDPSAGTVISLPGECANAGGTVTCDLGRMAAGETEQLTIVVRVAANEPDAAVIGNCAAVYSTTTSPDLSNAQSCVNTIVKRPRKPFVPVTG